MPDLESQLRSYSRRMTTSRTIKQEDVMGIKLDAHKGQQQPRQRFVLVGAMAFLILALIGVGTFASLQEDDGQSVAPAGSGPTTTSAELPAEDDSLIPPLAAGDLDLARILSASAVATDNVESTIVFGDSTYTAVLDRESGVTTFQYGQPGQQVPPANKADARIDVVSPAHAELPGVAASDPEVLGSGVTIVRLGEACQSDGEPLTPLSGYTRQWPCEFRALVIGTGYLAEVSARSEAALEALLSGLTLGSQDELRSSLEEIEGADKL